MVGRRRYHSGAFLEEEHLSPKATKKTIPTLHQEALRACPFARVIFSSQCVILHHVNVLRDAVSYNNHCPICSWHLLDFPRSGKKYIATMQNNRHQPASRASPFVRVIFWSQCVILYHVNVLRDAVSYKKHCPICSGGKISRAPARLLHSLPP